MQKPQNCLVTFLETRGFGGSFPKRVIANGMPNMFLYQFFLLKREQKSGSENDTRTHSLQIKNHKIRIRILMISQHQLSG